MFIVQASVLTFSMSPWYCLRHLFSISLFDKKIATGVHFDLHPLKIFRRTYLNFYLPLFNPPPPPPDSDTTIFSIHLGFPRGFGSTSSRLSILGFGSSAFSRPEKKLKPGLYYLSFFIYVF